MVSRALKPARRRTCPHTPGADGIALIVHEANPVTRTDRDRSSGIYTGKLRTGRNRRRDAPITVVNKAEGRSTLELFLRYFKLKAEQVKPSS